MNKKNKNIPQECFSEQELLDYISGNISEEKAKVIHNHINDCEICSDVVEGLEIISEPELFIANVENINNLIDNRIKKKKKKESFFTPIRSIAAAILILAAVGSVLIINQYSKNISTENISRIEPDNTMDVRSTNSEHKDLTESEPLYNEEKTSTRTLTSAEPDNSILDNIDDDTSNPYSVNTERLNSIVIHEDEIESDYLEPISTSETQEESIPIIDTGDQFFFAEMEDNEQGLGNASGAGLNTKDETISQNKTLDSEEMITDIEPSKKERRTFRSEKNIEREKADSKPVMAQESTVTISEDDYLYNDNIEEEDSPKDSSDKDQVNQTQQNLTTISYDSVEIKPIFPGGESAMNRFIHQNTNYPQLAIEQNIEGTVYVGFIIAENGEILNPTIYQGVDSIIDAEAINIVKRMPKWSPGKHKGENVKVSYILPVKFILF